MVLWIGLDDTDSLHGMCTSFLATELVRELTQEFDLIGYPRLVRLNPNIPWKTRGNGALCVRVGRGRGSPRIIGQIAGQDVVSYPRGDSGGVPESVEATVGRLVERWSQFDDEATNPAFVILRRQPSPGLYWKAVREVVAMDQALVSAKDLGVIRPYKNGRGVIGAVSATSWKPRDRTYEVLAYRHESRWGEPRRIDPESVIEMDRAFPSTFNSYDYENGRVVIAPRSPCPILFGIRGDDPLELRPALKTIRGEVPERWLIFETNQGTDDHVVERAPTEPYTTVRYRGFVTALPRTIPGGHVVFSVFRYPVAAYEPSKGFRRIVRGLIPGDRVQVIGAIRKNPQTLNLEKLHVEYLASAVRKVANPMCPSCKKRAKSSGRGAGFRCLTCRRHLPASAADFAIIPRSLSPGWYEPSVGSRRHLSRPLKRSTAERVAPLGIGTRAEKEPRAQFSAVRISE